MSDRASSILARLTLSTCSTPSGISGRISSFCRMSCSIRSSSGGILHSSWQTAWSHGRPPSRSQSAPQGCVHSGGGGLAVHLSQPACTQSAGLGREQASPQAWVQASGRVRSARQAGLQSLWRQESGSALSQVTPQAWVHSHCAGGGATQRLMQP